MSSNPRACRKEEVPDKKEFTDLQADAVRAVTWCVVDDKCRSGTELYPLAGKPIRAVLVPGNSDPGSIRKTEIPSDKILSFPGKEMKPDVHREERCLQQLSLSNGFIP
jgi:hypothetical protein